MRNLKDKYLKNKERWLFWLGLLVVSLIALPYILLGEGSYVQIHDQMDGEILNYICQAKYLFRGESIPEFMNGMDKASMTVPAPLGVLFYKVLPPFGAFALLHWICLVTGFAGMYRLCRYCRLGVEVCFLTACIFCYIPFYPVYGLAALGQPMLVYSYLKLASESENIQGAGSVLQKLMPFLGIAFYGLMSSLTLVGYVWVAVGLISGVLLWCGKKHARSKRILAGTGMLTVVYVLTNLDLLRSLTGKGFLTHRSEMVLSATDHLMEKAGELLLVGGSYSPVYSGAVLIAGLLFVCAACFMVYRYGGQYEENSREHLVRCMQVSAGIFGLIILCTGLAVLWNCRWVVDVRNRIGGMAAYFQADRIYWTFPFLWMFLMAWVLEGMVALRKMAKEIGKSLGRVAGGILAGCAALLVLVQGLQVLRDNTLNKNLRLILLDNYEQVTWESLYMEEVFEEIDNAIGTDKEKISVVSLGIYPSVALYNGYTCADGYSNNYDLEYKHAFRRIIASELEKNPELRAYFDDWGNRLYLAAQPLGINAMVPKGRGMGYDQPEFNVSAMKELNIGYLLSAAPVVWGEDTEEYFELVEGSPFSDENSYYEIWVYRIR